jgi:phage tail sheath gpL-like
LRSVVFAVGIIVFSINPTFACGSAEPDYQYGEAELRAVIEGTWSAALVRAAHACGTRTLIASANACTDATEMPLDVTFIAGDSALQATAAEGSFRVDSLIFTTGVLELAIGGIRISASVDADGNVMSSALIAPLGGTAALEHVSP